MNRITLILLLPGVAWFQPAWSQEPADEAIEEIVVTGSHIKGLDIGGNLPVTTLSKDDLLAVGASSTEELLAAIPQAGGIEFSADEASTSSNSVRGDVASFNLRELGADSTLTLVNGRRMVVHPSSTTVNGVPIHFVNQNTIPTFGIERVEVLRDGASALYGSDAVAGVVNWVLDSSYEGLEANIRYGGSEGTSLDEATLQIHGGFTLGASERTNVTFFASGYDRTGMNASDRSYSRSADHTLLAPYRFQGDTSLNDLSSFTPWGQFRAGFADPTSSIGIDGERVQINGVNATSSSGQFHYQPAGIFPNASQSGILIDPATGLEIDDGSLTSNTTTTGNGIQVNDLYVSRPLRFDQNSTGRQISGDAKRLNFFGTLTHEFDSGLEFFSEVSFYDANLKTQQAGPQVISDVNNMVVPATSYYNPFGPIGSPNRLAGSNAPAEGYDILIERSRITEAGNRHSDVDTESQRFLVGLRGTWNDWDWESAAYTSSAETNDSGLEVSRSLFYAAVSRTDATAYNPWNGLADSSPGSVDFEVNVNRKTKTKLSGVDFRVSTPSLFSMPGGDAGLAFGVEARNEKFDDDRDPRLDGTITFTNPLTMEFFDSDLAGVSATPDVYGKRDVISAYGEIVLPLVSPDMSVPLVNSFDVQLALRWENYSDLDDANITKPRIAVAWSPFESFKIRAAYSEGFRAPNLETINLDVLSRFSNNVEDLVRCAAQEAGAVDAGACAETIVSNRFGNTQLRAEESENVSYGFVFEPTFAPDLTVTVDWWKIEQDGIVGLFGRNNHLALDAVLRLDGSFNPAVVRVDPNAQDILDAAAFNAANGTNLAPVGGVRYVEDIFLNLQPRTTEGVDFGVFYDFPDTAWGQFSVDVNVAYLRKFDQIPSASVASLLAQIEAVNAQGLTFVSPSDLEAETIGSQIETNASRPKYRGRFALDWRRDSWSAGLLYRYVGKTFDTFVDDSEFIEIDQGLSGSEADAISSFMKVDAFKTISLWGSHRFETGRLDGGSIRVGVNNLTDEEPPLVGTSAGYSTSLHSNRGRYWYVSLGYAF
ncbi:MAG TPA: TonB-dependent receptor [Woeseiaceae bacterium]|nr:TonB-dependent receptor [Woeseiaceae bacterium]